MGKQDNPFTGDWTFNAERSHLSSPAPKKWLQWILVTDDIVQVREEITGLDGSVKVVGVTARFDGTDYPVTGSPVADVIAYTLVEDNNISGIAKKNDNVSLRETLSVAPDAQTLALAYSVFMGQPKVAHGIAVFDRAHS